MSRISKVLIGLAVIAALVAVGIAMPLGDWMRTAIEWVNGLGVLGVLAFAVLFTAICLTPLPSQPIYLAAGMLYGWLWGGLLTTALGLIVELCSLGIMRTRARAWVERRRDKHEMLKALDKGISNHSFKILLLLRLSPMIPFGTLNYALALTKIPVWKRLAANAIGMLPNCLMFAYVGSMLSSAAKLSDAQPPGVWKWVVLAVGVVTIAAASVAAAWGDEARYGRRVNASVSQLWRFPVKSMNGERLESAHITEATGILGDCGYALLDVATGRIASAKHPRHWAPLLGFKARVVERDGERHPRVEIELPEGKRVHTDDADVDTVLSATLGRDVKLISTPPKQVTYDEFDTALGDSKGAPLAVGAPQGTFFDFASLHIVTTGTLAKLRELRPESRFEVARFRPNIVVETGDSGFHENDWNGHLLSIGDEVQAYVEFPCPRCVMTTLAQGDLPADPNILKTATANTLLFPLLAKKLPSVGIYASVVRGGTVRAGDQVRVEGRSAKRAVGKYVHALRRAVSRR